MCGVCATYGIDDPEPVRWMAQAMVHRGPDDGGTFFDGRVGLGSRRLSIIDLSDGGHQPMSNEDGSIELVFNGEIYNHQEIRRELLAKGHQFRGASDTEIIVHLYEEAGPDCLRRLRGMFGLILWDRRSGQLLAARDPLGIKPLYWAEVGKGFVFASELTALMASGLVQRRLNVGALRHLLSFGSVPAPLTVWQGVSSLLPGERMIARGLTVQRERYWEPPIPAEGRRAHRQEAALLVRELLEESVRLHMIADVPVGVFLSGGFDSSLMVALASRCSPQPLRTFTVGFPDARRSMDERGYARPVAHRYGSEHTEVTITASDVAVALPHFVEHLDQPSVDALNTYLVSRAARGQVKAVISGLGGDELFGGYSTLRFARLAAWLAPASRRVPRALGRLALRMNEGAPLVLRSAWPWRVAVAALGGLPRTGDQYALVRFLFDDTEKHRLLLNDPVEADTEPSSRALLEAPMLQPPSEPTAHMAYLDLTRYMADTLLRDTDVTSMAHSLEVRVPYLDLPLVEAVLTMPAAVRWGPNGQAKHLLRCAFSDLLPETATSRRKMGFALPMEDWLRHPALREVVGDCLSAPSVARRGLFQPEAVRQVVRDFYGGPRLHRNTGQLWQRLWLLVTLELWLRRHLDQQAGGPIPARSDRRAI